MGFKFNPFTANLDKVSSATGMTSFTLTGDSGSDQTIVNADSLDVAGGTGIDTVVGATDTVTVAIDATVSTVSESIKWAVLL